MKFNDAFFFELGVSPLVTKLVTEKANKVAAAAISGAPVDTGAYRSSIGISVKTQRVVNVAVVTASDPKAMIVESRTGNLARALRRAK